MILEKKKVIIKRAKSILHTYCNCYFHYKNRKMFMKRALRYILKYN